MENKDQGEVPYGNDGNLKKGVLNQGLPRAYPLRAFAAISE